LFGWLILLTYIAGWGWAIGLASKTRPMLFRAIVCTLTLLTILGCLELSAGLRLVHWSLVMQQLAGDGHRYTWAYQLDNTLEFRRIPNDHWSERSQSDIERGWNMPPSRREPLVFTYDRWGYRNPLSLAQADVVLIGDSYVEGWYVSDAQTLAHHLQAQLGRPVVNLGVAGYGTLQELRLLKQEALHFQPKVVVWFFFEGNDLDDDARFENFLAGDPFSPAETQANPQGLAWNQGWQQRSFTLAALRQLRRWSTPVLPSHPPYVGRLVVPGQPEQTIYFADYAARSWGIWEADRWQRARDTLQQAVEFCHAQGIPMLFVLVPIKFRVYRPFVQFAADSPCRTWRIWPLSSLFTTFCQAAEVPCLDVTELFQHAIRTGSMPYAAVDSHWGPAGHALVAKRLALELAQRGWLSTSSPVQ
jgi:hypothetical protein